MPVQSGFLRPSTGGSQTSSRQSPPAGRHRSRSRASPHRPERETRLGSDGAPARPTLPPRAEPTVSQQPASGRRACLGASYRGGGPGAPGSSERPRAPGPAPLTPTHTHTHSESAAPVPASPAALRRRRPTQAELGQRGQRGRAATFTDGVEDVDGGLPVGAE